MRALGVAAVVCVALAVGAGAWDRRRAETGARRRAAEWLAYLRWLERNDPPAYFRYLTRDVARAYS